MKSDLCASVFVPIQAAVCVVSHLIALKAEIYGCRQQLSAYGFISCLNVEIVIVVVKIIIKRRRMQKLVEKHLQGAICLSAE